MHDIIGLLRKINFQSFLFDAYFGYFLEALPVALLISTAYGIIRYSGNDTVALRKKVFSCLFVCYLTGLICLVIGLDVMRKYWYLLLYRKQSGIEIRWFAGVSTLELTFTAI